MDLSFSPHGARDVFICWAARESTDAKPRPLLPDMHYQLVPVILRKDLFIDWFPKCTKLIGTGVNLFFSVPTNDYLNLLVHFIPVYHRGRALKVSDSLEFWVHIWPGL